MFEDSSALFSVLLRFGHIIFGIVWLGHLCFLNLVNVPFQADIPGELKPRVNPALLLRVFWWFRWAALYTFIFGVLLMGYKYQHQRLMFVDGALSNRGKWILFGAIIGNVMFVNAWFVIWPRQKAILTGLIENRPHPGAAKMAATVQRVSRFNLYASGPMLFGMIVPNNDPGLSPVAMILALIVGSGFWFGLIKRSFKVKTTVV